MYDSCMDTATIEARGITPLEGFLQRVESLTLENLFETVRQLRTRLALTLVRAVV